MLKRTREQNEKRRCAGRLTRSFVLLLCSTLTALAAPASEYHKHIQQAVTALDTLKQSDETETATTFSERDAETIRGVRSLLPPNETVEWEGKSLTIDNDWLHKDLDQYTAEKSAKRYELLKRIIDRLKAIDERLTEDEKAAVAGGDKNERSRKLREILQRPEYARKAKPNSALPRLIEKILEWIKSWLPRPKPISPGNFGFISRIAQIVIFVLAVGLIVFVLAKLLPRLLGQGRPKKKVKEKARIVLGEHLEPDQSARDLLAEAEALARRGDLRAAIRRAYIALLVELGDRKVISLAHYKTNRDYLRAVREVEPLYGNVKQLTDSFERHWYGISQATETDWRAFRAAYDHALHRT